LRDVKAISWELQHTLIIADVDKRKLKNTVKKNRVLRRRVWKLKESNIGEREREIRKETWKVGKS